MYVANRDSNDVSVIDGVTNAVIKTIPVGNGPWDLTYNPGNSKIFVADFGAGDVSVISSFTNKVTKTINVGDFPRGLQYDPNNKYTYVANFGSDDVSVISSSTIIIGPAPSSPPDLKPIVVH